MFAKLREKYRYSWILLRELVRTDFKLRYQGSVLGYAWAILKPLLLFAILYFVFVKFLRVGDSVPHWPAGMLFGILLWNFFSETTNNSLGSIVGRGDLIRKINIPKYTIILSSAINALINLGISMVVILVFAIVNGVNFSPSSFLVILPTLELFIFALGIGFIFSTLFVRFRDVNMVWEIIMQALFYGSAVIWPLSMISAQNLFLAKLMLLNPIANCIQQARHWFISPANETLWMLTGGSLLWNVIPHLLVIGTFVFGVWFFRKNSPKFAEEI